MKSKHHFLSTTIAFIFLFLVIDEIRISMLLAPIAIAGFPDYDIVFRSHRNWFFHSIIPWTFILLFNYNIYHALFVVSIGFHCLCDITFRPSRWTGYYCIKLWKRGLFPKGKNGIMSTVWYGSNFVISILILSLFV